MGGWKVFQTTLLNLPQNWVICIEKGGPNNFAKVITILRNLHCKHCLLIKTVNEVPETKVFLVSNINFTIKIFTWGPANDENT